MPSPLWRKTSRRPRLSPRDSVCRWDYLDDVRLDSFTRCWPFVDVGCVVGVWLLLMLLLLSSSSLPHHDQTTSEVAMLFETLLVT